MKLICPNCQTEHDSTYLHPSMDVLMCKMCDTEFAIDNTGWEDTLPIRFRPPEGSDIQMHWATDDFLEVVLPPKKPHWMWTTIKTLIWLIVAVYGYRSIRAFTEVLWNSPAYWVAIAVGLMFVYILLAMIYKNLIPLTEYQKIRINKDEIKVDKVNIFQQKSSTLQLNSAKAKKYKREKESILELYDYKDAVRILERLSDEEKEWTEVMLKEVLVEARK